MIHKQRHAVLLLALGLVLVASPAGPAALAAAQPQVALEAILSASAARSVSDREAVEALVAGLRDTVRFLNQHQPRPETATQKGPSVDLRSWLSAHRRAQTPSRIWQWDTGGLHVGQAVLAGRLNLPPPLV